MSIVVTHECNKKCPFCIDKNRGILVYITIDKVLEALKHAKDKGIKDILLVGGEPTLHKDITTICKVVKLFGFNLILTTNYTLPEIVKKLDGIVDSFNISFYNQSPLPDRRNFHSDLTLSTLIFNGQLDTKQKLDEFIDKYKDRFILKFSTLAICNDWTKARQKVDYLDKLECEKVVLFDEIEGQIYRGFVIKRYDKIINPNASQSLKCLADGSISTHW